MTTPLPYRELVLNMTHSGLSRTSPERMDATLKAILEARTAQYPAPPCPVCRHGVQTVTLFADDKALYAERWLTCMECGHCYHGDHATTSP